MSSDFWVARLNGDDAATVWPNVAGMLAPAIAGSSGLFEIDDVRQKVTAPNAGAADGWALWILAERDQILGAWTTKVGHFPRARVLEIVFAGGTDMSRYYTLGRDELEKYAREIGCGRLHCAGRSGWQKFGWTRLGHLFERILA